MEGALAVLVAASFAWSVVLFFAAVFIDERDQEAGFGWALVGALVYIVTFSDHLPVSPTGMRVAFEVLPGVTPSDSLFASSSVLLWALFVVYLLRIFVFYQVLTIDIDGDGEVDDVNDLVAPFLSYVCFVIATVAAISGLYSLTPAATVAFIPALVALYYYPPFLRLLRPYLDLAYETIRSYAVRVALRIGDILDALIEMIARASIARRGGDVDIVDGRASERRRESARRSEEAKARRRMAYARIVQKRREEELRRRDRWTGRRRAEPRRRPPKDPNLR